MSTSIVPAHRAWTALVASLVLSACGRPADDEHLQTGVNELEQAVTAAQIEIGRLEDFDALENLAGAYGHYVDKSQQDDIADLFTTDGVVEILGRGVFIGQDRVRQYMHNLGPVGPREGALFNHMHLQPVVDVSPDGETAYMRSRLFVMFGIYPVNAQWGSGVYENVAVKENGIWKLKYLHAYQTFYTNYAEGWAKHPSGIFAPYDRLPPDRPQSVPYDPYPAAFVPPFHYRNPVSGRADHYRDPSWHDTASADAAR
jgi:SnoaL-like domain